MATSSRRSDVMNYILEHGSVQIEQMMAEFQVSRMTIHRDLDALEQQGVVRKVRGGATALPSGLFESNYRYRARTAVAEKRALAAAAATHTEPGESVILDDSTTVAFLAERLAQFRPLTVVTNGLAVVEHLQDAEGVSLIVLGGRYSRNFHSFLGLTCEQAVAGFRASVLFMSAAAVSGTTLFHQDEQVVKAKRAMMEVANRRILLLDHSKFGATALNRLAELAEFDCVMVTDGIRDAQREAIEEAGIRLTVVPVSEGPRKGG